jgi:hypothetical protein
MHQEHVELGGPAIGSPRPIASPDERCRQPHCDPVERNCRRPEKAPPQTFPPVEADSFHRHTG